MSAVKATTKSPPAEPHNEEIKKLQEELNIKLEEWHCGGCGRFLCLQAIVEGTIVMKCRRCKKTNVLDLHGVEIVEGP